jgi:hypothetical protein
MAALLSGLMPRGLRRESYRLRRDGPTCHILRRESYQLRRDGLTCVYVRRVSYHSVGVAFFHARTFCEFSWTTFVYGSTFLLFVWRYLQTGEYHPTCWKNNKQKNKKNTHTRNSMRFFQGSVVSALPGPNGSGGGGSVLQYESFFKALTAQG